MKKIVFLLLIFILSHQKSVAQIVGCTDPQATNYNPAATYNNGSCTYTAVNQIITPVASLPAQLDEISGMIYYNGELYGHQDSGGGTSLYQIDPASGAITKTIILAGTTNVDWEDMTQDPTHIYVCDTGNNVSGNRTNLKIYKFPKSAITAGSVITIAASDIETIHFAYSDQTNFAPQPVNSTSFDCEAVAYNRGKLHLITKNWLSSDAVHYVLPTAPGTYLAERFDSINTGGVKITGADFGAFDELILIGYEITGFANCALFLDYGFDGSYFYFNTGCKRRLNISNALSNGQVEGICFENALKGYISNERFNPNAFLNVPPRIYTFDITARIKEYYEHNQLSLTEIPPQTGMIRLNSDTKKTEGYDGTHWVILNN
jgi:hypothetical protein